MTRSAQSNIPVQNNCHIYNSFIKFYYFNSPVMMPSFHLAAPKLPGNCAMFSLLSVGESPSTNCTIFVIGQTNSRCSAPTASQSLSLIVHTVLYREMPRLCGQLANYFDYSQPSEEQCLPSESFFFCFCTIVVLVMSE